MLDGLLDREDRPEHVGVELAVKLVLGDRFERVELVDSRVVDQNVDFAERLVRLLEQALYVFRLRDITLDGDSLAAIAGNLVYHAVSTSLAGGVVHHDGRALSAQRLRDASANTLGGAGHDSDLAAQLAHLDFTPERRLQFDDSKIIELWAAQDYSALTTSGGQQKPTWRTAQAPAQIRAG